MHSVTNKLVLLAGCCVLLVFGTITSTHIAAMLCAVTAASLNGYSSGTRFLRAAVLIYSAACLLVAEFCFFLPLLYYDVFFRCHMAYWPVGILLTIVLSGRLPWPVVLLLALLHLVALLLKRLAVSLEQTKVELIAQRDDSRELHLLMEQQNRSLLEKQDYEVRLATLNERNRIAREIHDNVGHLLSRSILQVGALMAVNQDTQAAQSLSDVKHTLSDAMDTIRKSVHNLHDESIDLQMQVSALLKSFSHCSMSFSYDAGDSIPSAVKICFLTAIKEALNNIMKHSNATEGSILIREHPGFYQLVIRDNGRQMARITAGGMGIENIKERVSALSGNLNIHTKDGFCLYITVPKEAAGQ